MFERLPEFIGNNPILVAAFVGLTIAIIVTEFSRFTRGFKSLSPTQLTALINQDSPLLADVSSAADYEKGHIIGARHIPMSQFDPDAKLLAKAREQPVAVICRNGATSSGAAKRLVKAGFTKVYWLDGGVAAWTAADMPLASGRDKPEKPAKSVKARS